MAFLFGKEDFEGGSLPASFDSDTVEFGTDNMSLDGSSKVNGTYSVSCAATNECGVYLRKDLASSYATLYSQFEIMIPTGFTHPSSGYFTLMALGTTSQNVGSGIDVEIKIENYGSNRLIIHGSTIGYTDTGIDISADTPTRIEVKITKNTSTGRIQIWVDNDTEGSPDYDSGNINTGANAMQRVFAGMVYAPNAMGTFYIDDIVVDSAFIGAGDTSVLEQEGFAFGDDDGSESAHTLDTQDTNVTEPLGTKTLRVLLDATDDPASKAYKLKYQKNGSGGYVDVPVGSGGTQSPSIATGDETESGDNATTSSINLDYPAYSDGDLIILNIASVNYATGGLATSMPSGPNGETIVKVIDDYSDSDAQYEPTVTVAYFIGDGSHAAGTLSITSSINQRWTGAAIKVPAGEFDPTTPISSQYSTNGASSGSTLTMTGFSADTDDGGGQLVAFACADQDPISGTDAGWTDVLTTDRGRSSIKMSTRDSLVTNSETISSATWTIASDAWAVVAYIVRPAIVTNEIYVEASSNVASGGEATTARLTAPSGKTTGDFTTGRRWDDENGDDSIDIASDEYTELEWVLKTQSPATTSDYYEFRVYDGDTALDTYTVTPKWTIGTASTDTNDERDVELTGQASANSARSAELTGQASANSARNAEITGIDTDQDSRNAEISGIATSQAERGAEVTGQASDNDSRNAETTGQDTANAERAVELTGKQSDNDSRSAELSGIDTDQDSRSVELTGSQDDNDERNAELTGQASDSSSRSSELTGKDTSNNERSAEITGQDSSANSRSAEVTGKESSNAERSAELHGSAQDNDSRSVELSGVDTDNSSRAVEITGQQSDSDERSAELTGQDTSQAERDIELTGAESDNDARAIELSGIDTDQSSRGFQLTGSQDDSNERAMETEGIAGSNSSRSAEIHGQDSDTSERSIELTGADTDQSEKSAELTGADLASSNRSAETHGMAQDSDERSIELTGKQSDNNERSAELTGKDTSNASRSAETHGIDTDSSNRAFELTGKESDADERNAELIGQDSDASSRSAEVTGQDTDQDERGAEIHGKLSDQSSIQAELTGQDTDVDSRSLETTGVDTASSYRGFELTGVGATKPVGPATVLKTKTNKTVLATERETESVVMSSKKKVATLNTSKENSSVLLTSKNEKTVL